MGKQWKLTDFILLPKLLQMVTEAMKLKDTCSLGKKAMTNLDSILRSRDITLPTKVCIVKAIVSTVVTYGCESWTTIKEIGSDQFLLQKADRQRIEAFELWYWGRLLRVPWTARRSNQSILNILISWRKSTLNIHWKNWCWSWSSNILGTWCEEPTH